MHGATPPTGKPPHGPLLVAGALYSADQIMAILGISGRTLARFEQAGLQPLQPATKVKFYASDDVIAVMRKPAAEIPAYAPQYKRKGGAA